MDERLLQNWRDIPPPPEKRLSEVGYVIEHLFKIYDKEGKLVPFKLNKIQREIDKLIVKSGELRSSILKYRQGGVTTYIMAWFLVECMRKYTVATMLAHDKEHTEKLLQRARLMLMNLNGPKPTTSRLNENEIFFTKTQSAFYIGTAGNVNFGRSATITHLHCSEIAFWKDPKTLLTGLHQAVPHKTGVIVQETTANGFGNWFQKQYYNYISGVGRYKGFFFPWNMHEEYTSDTPMYARISKDEEALQEKYGLSRKQLQWRREKIDELGGDVELFQQEYPLSYEEAFKATGGSLFPNATVADTEKLWRQRDSHTWYLKEHPRKDHHYILGVDSSGGTGNDYASIVGICLETMEQVLAYRNRYINPPSFAEVVVRFGKEYNDAFLVPESNSHGLSVIAVLKKSYRFNNIYRNLLPTKNPGQTLNVPSYGYGWKTSATTKPYMVGIAQKFVDDGIKLYDPMLVDELLSFSETEEGKLEGSGDHDDNAVAFMLACVGALKVAKYLGKAEPTKVIQLLEKKVSPEDRMKKFRDEKGRYLIPFEEIIKEKKRRSSFM